MKEELKKELEELSPFLLEMKEKPEGMNVPNHFFNNMRLDIMNKVKIEEQKAPVEKSWLFDLKARMQSVLQPRLAFGLASVFVIAVISFLFISKNITSSQSDVCNSFSCVSDEEASAYVDENINDFDEKIVWDALYGEDENNAQAMTEKTNETNKNLKLENASPKELDEIVDEMLKNGELGEDEL